MRKKKIQSTQKKVQADPECKSNANVIHFTVMHIINCINAKLNSEQNTNNNRRLLGVNGAD